MFQTVALCGLIVFYGNEKNFRQFFSATWFGNAVFVENQYVSTVVRSSIIF